LACMLAPYTSVNIRPSHVILCTCLTSVAVKGVEEPVNEFNASEGSAHSWLLFCRQQQ
jgi:hypothetical protein